MDSLQSNTKKVVNIFQRMWLDSLLSLQNSTTYIEAWNAVIDSDSESNYGISNEPSNELFIDGPGEVRGVIYVEERDQYVVFINNKGVGEIGLYKEKTKSYSKITTTDIAPELGITQDQWIDCEVKIMQPCNHLYLYWSSGDVYKRLNLDDPCCKFEEIPLIKPVSVETPKTELVERGGGLANGIYQFAAQAVDTEGNTSNWSAISNPISVSDGDHKPGEISNQAINITISGMSNRDYHLVNLAVLGTVNNVTFIEKFATVSSSSDSSTMNYLYTGKTGDEVPILLSEIKTRTNRYIRGKNLIQYDNRLILYNLRPIANLDYQRQANQIETYYGVWLVPMEYASRFKSFRNNENYQPAIRWRYTDGTFSHDYLIPGLPGGPGPCDPYQDTSIRTNTIIDLTDLKTYKKEFEVGKDTDYTADKLLDDETTAVDENDIDEPTIGDEINDQIKELDHGTFEMGAAMDCICEIVEPIRNRIILRTSELVDEDFPAWGPWDIDDDIIGLITLEFLRCACTNRTISEPDTGGNGGSTEEPTDGPNLDLVTSDILAYLEKDYVSNAIQAQGRFGERSMKWLQEKTKWMHETLIADKAVYKQHKGIKQGSKCHVEGQTSCIGDSCFGCRDGEWVYLNASKSYDVNNSYTKSGPIKNTDGLGFEYEYGEDGCSIIGIRPKLMAEGKFGAWQIDETYPMTLNCECDYVYGDLAGKKIRLHHTPSLSKEPHVYSFSSGVPNRYDMANSEFKDTYAAMIGPIFRNIQEPKNPPKPIAGYEITYVERTEANRSVIGTGLGHSCFLGDMSGEPHAFAKHAANSFERYDRHIEPAGDSTFRGGGPIDVGAYFIHSPDFHMRRPPLNATHCLIELEMEGEGFRHGMFAKGEKPETKWQDTVHKKGTRQAINLNRWISPRNPIVREVKAMSRVGADRILSKADKFTYSFCNLSRESGVYIELDGALETFVNGDNDITNLYGGTTTEGDNASDRSFTGDIYTESIPIHDARAHMMTFIKRLPRQYGSPISQAYIPLGLSGKSGATEISGLVGDSFVGPMTYKRPAIISDKTNRVISRFILEGGLASTNGFVRRLFGNILTYLFRVLGIRNGGYIPKNQDKGDFIRVFGGLRFINKTILPTVGGGDVTSPGEYRKGEIPEPFLQGNGGPNTTRTLITDINLGDNYVPQTLVTQITSHFPADVNLNFRQRNNVEIGEVYYSHESESLKGLKIDSSMPEDTPWEKGWLNRFGSLWKENAKWKLLVQAVYTFVFNFGIGIWMIWEGVGHTITGLQAIGGGTYTLQTIGGVMGAVFGIVLIFVGIVWMVYWTTTDADNKFIAEMISMKNLYPDRKNADGSYSFDESRLRQFENNFWLYDNTHHRPNYLEVGYGMPDPFNTCSCPTEYTNKIIYSNRQNMESQVDSWRNFKPNNNLEIRSDHGQIQKMFVLGNSIYAHTTDMLISLQGGRGFGADNDISILGTGDLFAGSAPIYGGVVEGYAGLLDPNAAEVSAYGYFFPDREAKSWYRFTGGGLPAAISDDGVRAFMDENMGLELLETFPCFKLVDLKLPGGIGYSFGVDHQYKRLLFTKVDYKPLYPDITLDDNNITFRKDGKVISLEDSRYFENKSFTLSYHITKNLWISFHNYTPFLYLWNRFNMYSFHKTDMYIHNVRGSFGVFYDEFYPFSIEYAVNDIESGDSFTYHNTVLGTEAFKWKGTDYVNTKATFDQGLFYNNHQMSGLMDFVDDSTLDIGKRNMEMRTIIPMTYKNGIWIFNNVPDKQIDSEDFQFNPSEGVQPKPVNKNNLSFDIKNNIFRGNYFANRLIFNKFEDIKLILKRVDTTIEINNK